LTRTGSPAASASRATSRHVTDGDISENASAGVMPPPPSEATATSGGIVKPVRKSRSRRPTTGVSTVSTSAVNPCSRACATSSRVTPSSRNTYSWNQRSEPAAATSAGVDVARVDRHIAVPTVRAARAIPTSPSGCATRWNATGATASGIDSSSPSTVVAVVQPATSTSTRGRSCQRPNAATLSRSVTSSPAPPA